MTADTGRRRRWVVVLVLAAAIAPRLGLADPAPAAERTPDLDARAQAIAARLRCPVCQNESVADSPAELAAQMRAMIRDRLAAGESEEQIIAYFVDRYGQWILLEPPRRGILWVVWLTPAAAVLAGAALAAAYLRRAIKAGAASSAADSDSYPSVDNPQQPGIWGQTPDVGRVWKKSSDR